MRRFLLLILLLAVELSSCTQPFPRGSGERPMAVRFMLRASLDDTIEVCQRGDVPSIDADQVLPLGRTVAEALGLPVARVKHDRNEDPFCASIDPSGPLT